MIVTYTEFIKEVRKAVNDIIDNGVTDDFATHADQELRLAIDTAALNLLLELDASRMNVKENTSVAMESSEDGAVHTVTVPDDFLRFVAVHLSSWPLPLYVLTDPASDKAMMQRSVWGRGTKDKPVCIYSDTSAGSVLKLYGGDSEDTLLLSYIPYPVKTNTGFDCVLKDSCHEALVWRSAAAFLDIRGMSDEADRCQARSQQC